LDPSNPSNPSNPSDRLPSPPETFGTDPAAGRASDDERINMNPEDALALSLRHGILTPHASWCLVFRRYPDQKARGLPALDQIPQTFCETRSPAAIRRLEEEKRLARMSSRDMWIDMDDSKVVDSCCFKDPTIQCRPFDKITFSDPDAYDPSSRHTRYPLSRPSFLMPEGKGDFLSEEGRHEAPGDPRDPGDPGDSGDPGSPIDRHDPGDGDDMP
jgi:hypothetical protein